MPIFSDLKNTFLRANCDVTLSKPKADIAI